MRDERLPQDLWELVQAHVPVFCVDVVPIRRASGGPDLELGLILRDTPDRGARWCVIGGRLLLDETISDGASRELRAALGESVTPDKVRQPSPLLVEYARTVRDDGVYDLRQHSVSTTMPLWASGEGLARGPEALGFRWWPTSSLTRDVMGFGQETLIQRIVAAVTQQGCS